MLTRRTSSILVVFIIILFLVIVSVLVQKQSVPKLSPRLEQEQLDQDEVVNAAVTLRDFHRTESSNGSLRWEIEAARGEYYPEEYRAELIDPQITFFDSEGLPVVVTAPRGRVFFQGEEGLRRADLHGGVVVKRSDGTTLKTNRMSYVAESKLLTAPGRTTITGVNFEAVSKRLTFNTESEELKLVGEVETRFSE